MKKVLASLVIVGQVFVAQAHASMNLDAASRATYNSGWCDGSWRPTTEWTCFARDAHGGALGVSTSFTQRQLAAGRALQSCQSKSSIPQTCAITRCNNKMECYEDNRD